MENLYITSTDQSEVDETEQQLEQTQQGQIPFVEPENRTVGADVNFEDFTLEELQRIYD